MKKLIDNNKRAQVKDVFIDSAGASVGILLCLGFNKKKKDII